MQSLLQTGAEYSQKDNTTYCFACRNFENSSRDHGNFLEFLELIFEYDPVVHVRLIDDPNNAKCTHHSIQDDILRSAAALVTGDIVCEINEAGVFSLQADGKKDLTKEEELSLRER